MKFDFCIGNPPYQADIAKDGDRANPVYDKFMDAAFSVANCVELIHPARFLFNAGQTPKSWNQKMLQDEHFTVIEYESDASKVFPNTEIKGGVAITMHNNAVVYGAIGTFTSNKILNNILKKIKEAVPEGSFLNSIIASQGLYRFSKLFFDENPNAINYIGKGTGNKIVSSIMEQLPNVFLSTTTDKKYVRFLGRSNNQRVYRYIRRDYLEHNDYIDKFKLFIPEANNTGQFGETLTDPVIGYPNDGSSDTYLSSGKFETIEEAKNFSKYYKTKFFRALLGIKKVTQHCPPHVWAMIPLQNFKNNSDLDWSKTIKEIDQQLYKKYCLSKEEIDFIEINVKEMK